MGIGDITAVIGVMSVLAVGFGNFFRYLQSRKFEIPFRITHSNLTDYLDVFFVGMVMLGGAFVIPLVAINYGARFDEWSRFLTPLIVFSFLLGIGLPLAVLSRIRKVSKGKPKAAITWLRVILCVLGFFTIAFYVTLDVRSASTCLSCISNILAYFAIVFFTLMLSMFILYIMEKLTGDGLIPGIRKLVATAIININGKDHLYMIAMRHSSKEWILLPCRVQTERADDSEKKAHHENESPQLFGKMLYYKNKFFIIRNLEGLVIEKDSYIDVRPENKSTGK